MDIKADFFFNVLLFFNRPSPFSSNHRPERDHVVTVHIVVAVGHVDVVVVVIIVVVIIVIIIGVGVGIADDVGGDAQRGDDEVEEGEGGHGIGAVLRGRSGRLLFEDHVLSPSFKSR